MILQNDIIFCYWIKKMCLRLFKYFCFISEPHLDWSPHEMINLKSDFQELIENRLIEVKRCSSVWKYYAKIGFQAFLYLLSALELIFTLIYILHNNIADDTTYFEFCYNLSIMSRVVVHILAWMYTYYYKEIDEHSFFVEITNYLYYMFMGRLSYCKLAPFIIYYNRDQSIKQFSFSQINKYQELSYKRKNRNPCRLFKDRKKPVNIFRDLIFHRVTLFSMMITMAIQTIPQLCIQGFFNQLKGSWDGLNLFCFGLLVINLINYYFEFQFIVLVTTYRQIRLDQNWGHKKIQLKYIYEIKQLLKSDQINMSFFYCNNFYIDPSNFSPYQKKKCMIQIQNMYKNIEFKFIDKYEEVTLQYLANCFKFIKVEQIILYYLEDDKLTMLGGIFNNIPNLKIEPQAISKLPIDNIETFNSYFDELSKRVQQIQFIQNPKITAGCQSQEKKYVTNQGYLQLSEEFLELIPIQRYQYFQHGVIIISRAKELIDRITKRELFAEYVSQNACLLCLYDVYKEFQRIGEKFEICIAPFIENVFDTAYSYFLILYMIDRADLFIYTFLVIIAFNSATSTLSFALMLQRRFRAILGFLVLNTIKLDQVLSCVVILLVNREYLRIKNSYCMNTRIKFRKYALRFQGNVATQVFESHEKISLAIGYSSHPFFQCMNWRSTVQDTFNVVPQLCFFFIDVTYLLHITIKDFFIPALILSTSSVDQFLQSIQYLSRIPNQILLAYPKSFSIMSKAYLNHIQKFCNFKINLKTINFSDFSHLKKLKKQAQFRYILGCIQSILEIDQAQRLFCMGSELDDLISCLIVSQIYQLKLNYYLDEVNSIHIPHINVIIRNCPKQLKFLQLQVEATNEHQMEFCVERTGTLIAFSYSYFQIIQQYRNNPAQVGIEINLNINDNFLKLDRYNFEEFYFEVSGNLILNNCEQLFQEFNYLKLFKASIINKGTIQSFQFSNNLRSKQLETLDITFENIKLDFQEYNFKNLRLFKMILINCEFNKDQLKEQLENLNEYKREIYIDISQCLQSFTREEQRDLIRKQELKGTDVVFKI
ncbi:unnamed protein product [Paramecium octaurelia]|uniref:Transmembrane protein n=1 Tax=Paramecium octaurelia TaxID=43137 RepID=A0A8S1UJ68_PAROT|nr:unnamed protein product [Paramecium octaurelia]